MTEDIFNPAYWKERWNKATEKHHSIFRCPLERWRLIEEQHKRVLVNFVKPDWSVLDVGCGWGRLLDLMPEYWGGVYLGVDLCQDFVTEAIATRGGEAGHSFICADVRQLACFGRADLAVLVSVRPMIRRNMGEEAWLEVEESVKSNAKRALYLEYDPEDEGALEVYDDDLPEKRGVEDAEDAS